MIAVRLPKEIEERLGALAKATGRTKTFYVKEAVLELLEDLEDYYLAEERMAKYDERTLIPLEDLMEKYGLLEDSLSA